MLKEFDLDTDGNVDFSAAIVPDAVTFYYTHLYAEAPVKTRLLRNFRFIGGENPMDFNRVQERAEIDDANAALDLEYGETGAFEYPDEGGKFGNDGWVCRRDSDGLQATVVAGHGVITNGSESTVKARYIVGPNGFDPFGGTCTAGTFVHTIFAQQCWDGHNLGSPNGRGHVRYATNRTGFGSTELCPDGWWQVPRFEAKAEYSHGGWTDYQYWYLSSDRMNPAMTVTEGSSNDPETMADPVSLSPCRSIGAYFCSGETMHFDWWGSWDQTIMNQWLAKCGGVSLPEYVNGTDLTLNHDPLTLKQAIIENKLDQFIAEHEGDEGDGDVAEATLRSMAGKSKEAPKASSRDDCDD